MTWKSFLDIAQFFTRDTDQDGTVDFYGAVQGARQGGQNLVYDVLLMFSPMGLKSLMKTSNRYLILKLELKPYNSTLI